MKRYGPLLGIWIAGLVAASSAWAADEAALEGWLAHLEQKLPTQVGDPPATLDADTVEACEAIDAWAGQLLLEGSRDESQNLLPLVDRLLGGKARIDAALDSHLALRTRFAALPADDARRNAIRAWLRTAARLIDLSGRLRYVLADAIRLAARRAAVDDARRAALVDLLLERRAGVGAAVLADALFDPDPTSDTRTAAARPQTKASILRLIAETGQNALLPELADFVAAEGTPAALRLAAAETIRAVGLPQDPRPGQEEDEELAPDITAAALAAALESIKASALDAEQTSRRQELLAWLAERRQQGLTEESYRLGDFDVRPGDWLLMRNPSPYNLFTDLSPGLFTHVGVVALEQGSDGIRRMVVVDLPERGTHMPATNVEVFVRRTLHYAFLRVADDEAARAMGQRAAGTIGNPTEFDLNFRTDRVRELRGQPLAGQKIKTYCAGLLLLCAQETGLAREQYFPIAETVAGGNTAENLAELGLSVGEDFISPTGALFSGQLSIVGRREPMYDPQRDVEEAIFDHFAHGLEVRVLRPSPNLFQALRLRLAEAARSNPLLAAALAQAADVSADMDLVAAAKAAAVVESLDEIAFGSSRQYAEARAALLAGPAEELADAQYTPEEIGQILEYRRQHADLFARWRAGELSPRALRVELVRQYTKAGQQALDERFFAEPEAAAGE
jgi:hypothetical protein